MSKLQCVSISLAFVMLCALLLPAVTFNVAATSDLAEKKEQMEQIDAQLKAVEEQLANIDAATQNQQANRDNASRQVELLTDKLSLQLEIITQKQGEIAAKQLEVDETNLRIADSQALLKQRLRTMYMTRTSGSLTMILAADTLSEFLTAADSLQRVAVSDTQLIERLDSDMKALKLQEEALTSQLADLEEEERALEQSKAEFANALQQADTALTELAAQEAVTLVEQQQLSESYAAAKAEYERAISEMTVSSGATPYVGGEFLWPVPGYYRISSAFGPRTLWGWYSDNHTGIDIATDWGAGQASINGAPIVASNDGVVTKAVYSNSGYGIYAMVDHGGGQITVYGHCSALAVTQGQAVTRGQTIAYVGDTGFSSGHHLHFEIRQGGPAVNPEPYLRTS